MRPQGSQSSKKQLGATAWSHSRKTLLEDTAGRYNQHFAPSRTSERSYCILTDRSTTVGCVSSPSPSDIRAVGFAHGARLEQTYVVSCRPMRHVCFKRASWEQKDEIEGVDEIEQIEGDRADRGDSADRRGRVDKGGHHPPFKGGTGRVSLEGLLGGSPKSYEGVHISYGLPRDV